MFRFWLIIMYEKDDLPWFATFWDEKRFWDTIGARLFYERNDALKYQFFSEQSHEMFNSPAKLSQQRNFVKYESKIWNTL